MERELARLMGRLSLLIMGGLLLLDKRATCICVVFFIAMLLYFLNTPVITAKLRAKEEINPFPTVL
jgi:hypothetical protein